MKKKLLLILIITGLYTNICVASDNINPLVNKPYSSTLDEANDYLASASSNYARTNCKKCHRMVSSLKISPATLIIEMLKNKKTFQEIHPQIKDNLYFSEKMLSRYKKKGRTPSYSRKRTLYLGMYLANFADYRNYDEYGAGMGTDYEKSNINHKVVDLFIHEIKMIK